MAKNFITPAQAPALIERAKEYAAGYCYKRDRAAVNAYIEDIWRRASAAAPLFNLVECGLNRADFERFLLAGAPSWPRASTGGAFLVSVEEISARAGGREFREEDEDNGGRAALNYQAGVLSIAARALFRAYSDLRPVRRQFYAVLTAGPRRAVGGQWISFEVFEHREHCQAVDGGSQGPARMVHAASGRYVTAGYRGEESEIAAALVKAGALPAECLAGGRFNAADYGEAAPLCAYCTIETLN